MPSETAARACVAKLASQKEEQIQELLRDKKFFLIVGEANQKSNIHYTRRITPKRVTSGEVHLRGSAPGLHSFEETSQRWRSRWRHCADLTGPGIEDGNPRPPAPIACASGAGTFFGQGGLKIVRSCQRLGGFAPQTPFSRTLVFKSGTLSRPTLIDINCMPAQVTGIFSG